MTYTPSTPGHAEMLERIALQHHEGASLEEIRKLVFQTYSLGYDAGVGEFFERQRTLTVDGLAAAAQTALHDEPTDRPEGVELHDASVEDDDIFASCQWIGGCTARPEDGESFPGLLCPEHADAPLADAMAYHVSRPDAAVQYEYGPSGLHGPGVLPHIRNAYVCTDDCDNSPCPAGIEHARCVPGCAVPRTEEPERTLTVVERTAMAALSPDELPDPIAGPHEHGYYHVAGLGYLPTDADCSVCRLEATAAFRGTPPTDAERILAAVDDKTVETASEGGGA